MDNGTNKIFDLTRLLAHSDFKIRKIATGAKDLTAGEYFDMLSKLMDRAPQFSQDLLKLMSRDGDRNTYKNLADMFTILKSLGYEKHEVDFEGMLDAYDRGQSRLTTVYAKKILEDFDGLCARVTATSMTVQPEDFTADPYMVSLKEWLTNRYVEDASKKPVILAIDDSPVILKSVSSLLSDDYKVYMLAKSVLLEKTLDQIRPDLFLLDYNMPIINGFELIPVIRRFVEHRDTPIIFLTSEGTIDNISSAVMLGACDFIVKPVKPSILRERISKHLNKAEDVPA